MKINWCVLELVSVGHCTANPCSMALKQCLSLKGTYYYTVWHYCLTLFKYTLQSSAILHYTVNLNNTDPVWKDTMQDLEFARTDQSLKMVRQAKCIKSDSNVFEITLVYFLFSRVKIMIINLHCWLWGGLVAFWMLPRSVYFMTASSAWVWSYQTVHCNVIVIVVQLAGYPSQCRIVASQDFAKLKFQIKLWY